MSGFRLGRRSLSRLGGVHEDLCKVVHRAIELTVVDFTVLEGLRSKERQQKLVASGASRTMRSRHLTGHAVDLGAWVDGEVRWDWPLYHKIAQAMWGASEELEIPIRWGGTWEERVYGPLSSRFPDGPHFELPRRVYP